MAAQPMPQSRIRELRKRHRMTQKDLGDRIGTTPQTVQRLETGNMTVSLTWLHKVAAALGVETAELIQAPNAARGHGPEEAFIAMIRDALLRARRNPARRGVLAMMEQTGRVAEMLLDTQAGLRPWRDVVAAAAAVAAAAMHIAIDDAPEIAEGTASPAPALRLASSNGEDR